MAAEMSAGEALEYEATVEEWFEGFCWVEIWDVMICLGSAIGASLKGGCTGLDSPASLQLQLAPQRATS